MPNNTEAEIKIRVADLGRIAANIEQLGGICTAPRILERNIRYEDAGETLTPSQRVLRLRQDSRARLTYKEAHPAGDGLTRTEIEIEVSDFAQANLFLQKIGFHPAWIYEKYRTTYHVLGCEVVLDETPIGAFIEIEGEGRTEIFAVVDRLGLSGSPYIPDSYSDLFFHVRQQLALPFADLTFANFAAVDPGAVGRALAAFEISP